jgi:nucleoside-diphosphate-sugar epimerase
MKIVVVGGSGLVGSKLVTMLTHDGHEVVAARNSNARATMDRHWWLKLFSLRLRVPPLRPRPAASKHLASSFSATV